ncbi:MAG: SPOR domain-containing protein [Magnetococcales bacterium]|nr:SPOR domain-containing protein [Magnetococcales bacterium]
MVYLMNPHAGHSEGHDHGSWRGFPWTLFKGIVPALLAGLISGCLPSITPDAPPAPPPSKPVARLLLHPFHEIGAPTDLEKARDRVQSFLVGRSQERFGLNYLEAGNTEVDPRSQSGMERLTALGITHLLTGRMKPPPNGFFLVELYEPPRTEPTLVRDIPIDNGKSLDAVVDMVMSELEERFKKENVTVLLGRQSGQGSISTQLLHPTPLERSQKYQTAEKSALKKAGTTLEIPAPPGRSESSGRLSGSDKLSAGQESAKSSASADVQSAERGGKQTLASLREGAKRSSIAAKPTDADDSDADEEEEQPRARSQGKYLFAIQVAAAPSVEDFSDTAERINQKGFRTVVHSTRNRNGKRWHFLWVGRFVSKEKALEFLAVFRKKVRGVPAFITPIDDGDDVSRQARQKESARDKR